MQQLVKEKRFAEVQRLFDLDAWQMFLAVNWPTNNQGQPAPAITDTAFGEPHWTPWQMSSQIYREDGQRPIACGRPPGNVALATAPMAQTPAPLLPHLAAPSPQALEDRSHLLLANLSAVGNISVLDLNPGETKQAFSGPLIDQNGNFVHYDIRLDPHEVGYVCQTGIYNINGQVAFSQGKPNPELQFPGGSDASDWSGATELKSAWKILKPGVDQPGRFFTMNATIPTTAGGTQEVQVGLVGLHIAHKAKSSPQWIWATFEQVDNLVGDPLANPAIAPSFYHPGCPLCAPNLNPDVTNDFKTPTQVVRGVPIPGDKLQLNAQAQAVLAKLGSVWQYYQLIDTQWPTDPNAKPTPPTAGLPGAIENKPGGDPTPVFLTNVTMETYFQGSLQPACRQEELPSGVSCPATYTATSKPPFGDNTQVFASESCMGCHSSAGLVTGYDPKTQTITSTTGQLSADFSWLPRLKAKYFSGDNH
jgi:hypothetical protein